MSSSQVFQNSEIMHLVQSVQAMNQAHSSWSKVDHAEREKSISAVLQEFQKQLIVNSDALSQCLHESIGVPK
ncbi:MAG: hypothetical protein U1E10_03435, partial [Bdellovibrionales bacterium]|nr:hypothetical protein [Bdellovibrionales bacterium]